VFSLRHSRSACSWLFFLSFFVVLGLCSSLKTLENTKGIKEKDIIFSGLTLPPASAKKPNSIVVLFHGYGDTGENFLLLGALLREFLPDTLFVAPDGPIACKHSHSGKQWLSAPKNNRSQLLKEMKTLTPSLNRYLDNLLKKYGILSEKLAFFGFSQGARIALHIGLRRAQCAGIIAFSGSYLDDPTAMNLTRSPILMIHGLEDQKVTASLARESYKRLEALKMPATLILLPGVGHDIDPQGLQIAGEFLRECLSGKMQ